MGLDKIYYTFYRYFGGNEDLEENDFDSELRTIPGESIFLDGNFILYQVIPKLESDLNNILKIILSISHNVENRDDLINLLLKIFDGSPLKNHKSYFEEIFYLSDLDEMIEMLNEKTINLENNENKIKEIIISYYLDYLKNRVLNLHHKDFIKSFYLIFDGIPSSFKIIEQRRRRIKNYLESNNRKKYILEKFESLDAEVGEYNLEVCGENKKIIYDYGKFVRNMITLSKSFGPSSNIFSKIAKKVRELLLMENSEIKYWYSGVDEAGEADFKILHLIRLSKENNIVIHCSDFDLLMLGCRLQNEISNKLYLIRHFSDSYVSANFSRLNSRILEYLANKYKIDMRNEIIDDFIFIINLFGNDYVPGLVEINFENNFNNIIEILGLNLWNSGNYLITNKKINMINLKIFLEKLKLESNSYQLINNLKEKFIINDLLKNLPNEIKSYQNLVQNILIPYWSNNIQNCNDWSDFYKCDIRIDIIQKYISLDRESLESKSFSLIKIDLNKKENYIKELKKYDELSSVLIKILDNILKPYEIENIGLQKKLNTIKLSNNSFDNFYYYFYQKSKKETLKKFYRLENKNNDEETYLLELTKNITSEKEIVLEYLLSLNFINYKFFNPMKLTYHFYNYYLSPKISWILEYIDLYEEKIVDYIVEPYDYIDSDLHLLLISANDENSLDWKLEFVKNNNLFLVNNNNIFDKRNQNDNFNNYRDINFKELNFKWKDFIKNKFTKFLNYKNINKIKKNILEDLHKEIL